MEGSWKEAKPRKRGEKPASVRINTLERYDDACTFTSAHTHTPGLPSRALASRQIVLRRYTRTKERVDDRFSDRDSLDREDGKGFLLANEKKLENGNEKEKNEIGE